MFVPRTIIKTFIFTCFWIKQSSEIQFSMPQTQKEISKGKNNKPLKLKRGKGLKTTGFLHANTRDL